MNDGGKGSSPRPFSVDRKTFDENWDKIFKAKSDPRIMEDLKNEDEAFEYIKKLSDSNYKY